MGAGSTPPLLGANSTRCLTFNGTDAYVSVPGLASTNLTGDFTAALWVYKQTDNNDWVRIIGKGANNVRTFGMWEEPAGGARILFQQYNGSGGAVISQYTVPNGTNPGTIPLTTWTHIACRVSGNVASVFINGQNCSAGWPARSAASGNDSSPVTFGYDAMPLHSFWNGRMDDIRLYNRALADPEIAALATGSQGPPAPSNLTATPGSNTVALAWTASGATGFNVKRATVSGGPYTTISPNHPTANYTDNSAVDGTTYYYVVSAISYGESPNSNEVSATPLPVTATPNTGLFTSEALASTPFTIKFNAPVAAGAVVTVVSNDTGEGVVSTSYPGAVPTVAGDGFTIDMSSAVGTTPSIVVTVTGVDDQLVDPATPYTVTVSVTNMGGYTIPNINLVNNDNDTANITFSRVNGLVTSESGASDTFVVTLTTQPYNFIDIPISSLVPAEASVSPSTLRFTPSGNPVYDPATGVGDWNTSHVVTVTGVDDSVLDFTIPFTIQTGPVSVNNASDNVYNQATPSVTGINLDNEVIPTLPPVWGGGGSGGCGLLGPELLLPFALLALVRRRRSHPPAG